MGEKMSTIARLREIAEAATPGPWMVDDDGHVRQPNPNEGYNNPVPLATPWKEGAWDREPEAVANGSYIAAFDPPTVKALLNVAEAAQGLTIGAGILSVLEDAGPAFTETRMALLRLRYVLTRLTTLDKTP